MKILVLNCGSSSAKFQLFEIESKQVLVKGLIERIGSSGAIVRYHGYNRKLTKTVEVFDHSAAIRRILDLIQDEEIGVIKDLTEIDAVGHRVVHGSETFAASVYLTPAVFNQIEDCVDLAPLHNPPNLKGIYACQRLLPGVPQVAVFDTAFHQTMPKKSWIYAVPSVLYKRHGVRRYGFHGTSHYYVSRRAAEISGQDIGNLKIISAHLGNGCSITAIEHGKSLDTSMGMTPLEGLVMGTRCGDIDPAIIPHIMALEELRQWEVTAMMNKHGGLYALSNGLSNDMRELVAEARNGHEGAQLAIDVFVHRLRKYIGAYAAVMGGVDILVFTAGIGENSVLIREKTCENMEFLGIHLDRRKNTTVQGVESKISTEDSSVLVLVIPTAEELVIALDTQHVVENLNK